MASRDAGQLQVVSTTGTHHLRIASEQSGLPISEILRRAQLPLNTRCGQRGLCDGCIIELLDGVLRQITGEQLIRSTGEPVTVRGCEFRLMDGAAATIHIPARSSLRYQPKVVTEYRINVSCGHDPLYQQVEMDLRGQPLEALIPQLRPGLAVRLTDAARRQAGELADAPWAYVILERRADHALITSVAAQPPTSILGAAIDIGTTTVALLLVDLMTGQIVGRASAFNEQMRLGDDVLTRINLCSTDPTMLRQLQSAVAERTIQPLLAEALGQSGARLEDVRCLCLAGNTTMLHLLAGIDPSPMGIAPFTAPFLDHRVMDAAAIFKDPRLHGPAEASTACHLLPSAAAYIGGDLTAGVVASGLLYDDGPSLLVDVGTNGEIILKAGGELFGCATAAGPAFEGAGLTSGMRAGDGAISDIHIDPQSLAVRTEMIGQDQGAKPAGICGSAYVDFLAQGRQAGLLGPTGRFVREGLALSAQQRIIRWKDSDWAFQLASAPGKQPIVISQGDVAKLLQAKAAIAAGILTLLERVGLKPADIRTLYLAGGFGTHLDRANTIACGLLPGFREDQIQTVGNTALAGAYLSLLDSSLLDELSRVGKMIKVVELNLDPHFEERYIDQLCL